MFQPYWNYTFSILFAICKEMKYTELITPRKKSPLKIMSGDRFFVLWGQIFDSF